MMDAFFLLRSLLHLDVDVDEALRFIGVDRRRAPPRTLRRCGRLQ
jgi:hypothetical protein